METYLTVPSRTIQLPRGEVLDGVNDTLRLSEPQTEAVCAYHLTFPEGFEWTHGGKLPGLGGGRGAYGGNDHHPSGWSARLMWRRSGRIVIYLYHQDKPERFGQDIDIATATPGERVQVVQRVMVNTPGDADGTLEMWWDGDPVYKRRNLRLRGDVDHDRARIDHVYYHVFYGGSERHRDLFAPERNQRVTIGNLMVTDEVPFVTGGLEDAPVPQTHLDLLAHQGVWNDFHAGREVTEYVELRDGRDRGQLDLRFELPSAATPRDYWLWAWVLAPTVQANSFYVYVDTGDEDVWHITEPAPRWQWVAVSAQGRGTAETPEHMRRRLRLGPGRHTLTFRGREPGCKLSRVLLTDDPDFRPTERPTA